MRHTAFLLSVSVLLVISAGGVGADLNPYTNPGFEDGLTDWLATAGPDKTFVTTGGDSSTGR